MTVHAARVVELEKDRRVFGIHEGAADNLRFIRSTMEAAHRFTTVSGRGCVAMGVVGLAAAWASMFFAQLESWLFVWLFAAVVAAVMGRAAMVQKARSQGVPLMGESGKRFFATMIPSFVSAAVFTAALYPQGSRTLLASIWLLSYGAGIAAGGVFSVRPVRLAGFAFMMLGGVAAFSPEWMASLFLASGFGLVNVALGVSVWKGHGG